jgi:hypothetical protein
MVVVNEIPIDVSRIPKLLDTVVNIKHNTPVTAVLSARDFRRPSLVSTNHAPI